MIFVDEDTRHEFHKQPALLQVVCQQLESLLYTHAYQLHVFNVDQLDNLSSAMVSIEPLNNEEQLNSDLLKHAINDVNAKFKRRDGKLTITPEHDDLTLLSVRVSNAQDLLHLN